VILADVNVLVYAFRREVPRHQEYASWLTAVVAGTDEFALHEAPLAGFVRIVTNAHIFERPAPTSVALEFVHRLVRAPRSRWLSASEVTWSRFRSLLAQDAVVRGNLVPDALLAAMAMAHGCRLATADRGFARFPGLDWFDPVAA
jgi:toxin-antitoxin system PIN domain toxin